MTSNPAVNRTPTSYAGGFPPLRSGAGYFQRYAQHAPLRLTHERQR